MEPTDTNNSEAPKNMPRDIMKHHDPAGTSPNRYAGIDEKPATDYHQKDGESTEVEDSRTQL